MALRLNYSGGTRNRLAQAVHTKVCTKNVSTGQADLLRAVDQRILYGERTTRPIFWPVFWQVLGRRCTCGYVDFRFAHLREQFRLFAVCVRIHPHDEGA